MVRYDERDVDTIYKDVGAILFGVEHFTIEMVNALRKIYPINLEGKNILEAGCGCGKLGMFFTRFGASYTGLDIDLNQIKYAGRIKAASELILGKKIDSSFWVGNVHYIGFPDNSYDIVFSEGVIEHWLNDERQNIVNEMTRVAKDVVMIFVPDNDSEESREIARTCVHTYVGMGEKEYPLTLEELKECLEKSGLFNVMVKKCCRRMLFGVGYKNP